MFRIKQKVGDLLQPSNVGNWEEVRDRLNQTLRGWSAYFSYGTRLLAYRAVENHVCQRVRDFLTRRHGVKSRGTRRFSDQLVYGELEVLRLRHVHLGARPKAVR
ncbi:MAG TPA: group II intron maturase-specific domain-containing protein [Bryobacteraceae bacterium]|nr:group II intron maturase-specific domain-containing protein [Bryobacteraceae bacterium]